MGRLNTGVAKAAALLLAAGLALTGCASGSTGSTAAKASDAKVELRYMS